MTFAVDIAWVLTVLLVSVRFAAITMFAPVFGPASIPASVKIVIALALSAFLVSMLSIRMPVSLTEWSYWQFAIAASAEAVIGAAFGFGFMAAFAATQIAGRLLDIQLGFGAASVLNPTTEAPSPLIGSLFGMTMVAAFLALDGHHVLLRAFAFSLESMPPTAVGDANLAATVGAVLQHSSVMFVFALALAAPVMFMLWLADVAMAVFARSMPQLNVFLLSFAVKVMLGIVGLALTVGIMRSTLENLFDATYGFWGTAAAP